MSAPHTPPNLEPELPEMATLREWSRHERPLGNIRHRVKTRVWQTLEHTTARPSLQRRGPSWPRTLVAAAIVVAVPGAFAATETGRHWAQQGLSMLLSDTATAVEPATQTRDAPWRRPFKTPTSPSLAASTPPEVLAPPEVTAAEITAPEVTEPTATPTHAAVRATPRVVAPAMPNAVEPTHGEDRAVKSEQVLSRQMQAERQILESARLALSRRDYSSARSWCTLHRSQFDKPILSQERETLEALVAAGEKPTAGSKKY